MGAEVEERWHIKGDEGGREGGSRWQGVYSQVIVIEYPRIRKAVVGASNVMWLQTELRTWFL